MSKYDTRMIIDVKDCDTKKCVVPDGIYNKCVGTNCMGWVWATERINGEYVASTTRGGCGMVTG